MKLGRVKQCDPHLCPFSVGRSQKENIREGSFIARLSWIVFLLNIPWGRSLHHMRGRKWNEIIFIHIFMCDGYWIWSFSHWMRGLNEMVLCDTHLRYFISNEDSHLLKSSQSKSRKCHLLELSSTSFSVRIHLLFFFNLSLHFPNWPVYKIHWCL